MMLWRQLHLDIRIRRPDRRRGRIGKIQAGVGQPDVVDNRDHLARRNVLANGGIDVIAQRGRLLDARAGAGAHVNLELAGIDGGKEVLPQPRRQQRHRADREHAGRRSGRRRRNRHTASAAQIAVAELAQTARSNAESEIAQMDCG